MIGISVVSVVRTRHAWIQSWMELQILRWNILKNRFNLLIVGNVDDRMDWLHQKLDKASNLVLTCLGDLVPIPRSFFEKVDVAIGGSGCARCAAQEKVPTICVRLQTMLWLMVVLGYTVFNIFFSRGRNIFTDELLKDALKTRCLLIRYRRSYRLSGWKENMHHITMISICSLLQNLYRIGSMIQIFADRHV